MCTVKKMRSGINAASGGGLARQRIRAQQIHDKRRLRKHLHRTGGNLAGSDDVIYRLFPHGDIVLELGFRFRLEIRVAIVVIDCIENVT